MSQTSPETESDPAMTPKEFVDSILSACDASNWDCGRNEGEYYRGLRDAYEAIHEIAGEYQTAMYDWTRKPGLAPTPGLQEAIADRLVDWTYLHATEGVQWPSTKTKSMLTARAMQGEPTQDHADGMKAAASPEPVRDSCCETGVLPDRSPDTSTLCPVKSQKWSPHQPGATTVEEILHHHFYTGEPGQYDAIRAAADLLSVNDEAARTSEPAALIDRRLEDLAEANSIYGKDQRLSAPDKIARNDREISWLKDLRLTILTPAQRKPVGFMEAMDIVEAGFNNWKGKDHNRKWWRRIDGTPIPNDLMVNISEAISRASLVSSTTRDTPAPQDEMENYRLALAWIKDQSTDSQAKEIAAAALDVLAKDYPADQISTHRAGE